MYMRLLICVVPPASEKHVSRFSHESRVTTDPQRLPDNLPKAAGCHSEKLSSSSPSLDDRVLSASP